MMDFFEFKKAQAFIWLGILVLIFVMGLLYIIFNEPVQKIKDMTLENITGSQYEDSYKKQNTIWEKFLFIFLIAIIAFGILTAMRKKDETY